ncbi:MAG: pyruvate, phosphate dikinase [Proteobacteria bacterium]|nr:pyruvate, phosphate dikinase [Pseudomonadota bacterium]
MRTVNFGTKAETLQALQGYDFIIADLFYFTVARWRSEPAAILDEVEARFGSGSGKVIVRSSSQAEDGGGNSMAGAFESILDVDSRQRPRLEEAISLVVASYGGDPADQVLIQPMVEDIKASGVIMTRCMDNGSPYYVINYDDESGRTDSVTGGTGASKTVYVYRGVKDSDFDSPRVRSMVGLARKLETVFGTTPLDIEFGLDEQENMHLFQVRRICTQESWLPGVEQRVSERILYVEHFVRDCLKPRPSIYGSTSILGVMPDWNPAEIIGITPRPLAASLYREIVTRRVWSQAREDMGYRLMPPEELMFMVAGRPYIDVRNSFNSFLPAGLSEKIGCTLVEAWLDRLASHPELHDKVEFEVALTIHDLRFDARMAERYPDLLDAQEHATYKTALLDLTNRNLDLSETGTLAQAEKAIGHLVKLQSASAHDFDGLSPFELLCRVKILLEDCRRFGTRPFSILARHGFIAETLLRSAVEAGIISAERVAFFKRTIQTISGEIAAHFQAVLSGAMPKEAFLERYGHLRPGTYDILSPRYADRKGLFDNSVQREAEGSSAAFFELSNQEQQGLDRLLQENGIIAVDALGLLEHMRRAVAGREYGKFVFTRNLSDALEGLAAWGTCMGFSREEVSHLTLHEIMESLVAPVSQDTRQHFSGLVEQGRRLCELAESFRFNYIIRSPSDVYVVPQHRSAPNFITNARVEAEVAVIGTHSQDGSGMEGRVVCIENADPGYDWIFTKGISGLVTKYGGANSHMAIRCAEFGLPAAIGCGELLFERISTALRCEINASDKILRAL